MDVRLPDGTIIRNVPEGTTKEQLTQKLQAKGMAVPAEWIPAKAPEPQASVKIGRTLSQELPRQGGLTLRAAAQGLSSFPGMVNDAIGGVYNTAANAIQGEGKGFRFQPTSYALGNLMDKAGVPQPETPDERVVQDAATLGFAAMSGAGLADRASKSANAVTQQVAQKLAQRPVIQTLSGVGAGGAGGSVRESGGGPWAQFMASLAGGILTPLAADKMGGLINGIASKAREIRNPDQLVATLRMELGRAGIQWDDLGANVKVQLQNDAKNAIYSGQQLDPAGLRRLADFRTVGATPLLGDITQDPLTLTRQRNLSKAIANMTDPGPNSLPVLENQNAGRVIESINRLGNSSDDAFATGQRIIGGVAGRDAAMQANEKALYDAARQSFGRDIPLDRGAFLNDAYGSLTKSNKMAFLPPEVDSFLTMLGQGFVEKGGQKFPVPFNVDAIDNLKTILANEARKGGNSAAAAKEVRMALERAQPMLQPSQGSGLVTQQQAASARVGDAAAEAMSAWDAARGAARNRRQWQESARFIEDALNGAAPDKFVQKHIIGGDVDELARIRQTFGNDPAVMASIKQQMVDYIRQQGGVEDGFTKFSSAAMKKAIDRLGDRKLSMFFDNQEIQQLKAAVNVGRSMQIQPIGSAVNNSNTAGTMLGQLLSYGRNVPIIGPNIAQPLESLAMRFELGRMKNLTPGLLSQPQLTGPALPNPMTAGLLAAPVLQPSEN